MLTATVRGPMEEFQKKLRSNPYSASDLEFPVEKLQLRNKTADAPTHNGQNGCFCPTRGVFQQYVGASAVLLQRCCFSAGSSKSDAERGFDLSFSEGPRTVAVPSTRRFDVPPSKYRDSSAEKVSYFYGAPQKICSKIKKFQNIF